MSISMYTVYALKQNFSSPVDAFSHFYKKGIHFADILDTELDNILLYRYCEYLNEAGMRADALVSTVNIADVDFSKRCKNVAEVKKQIELLSKYNIPMLMAAPNVRLAENVEELKIMKELLIQSLNEITEYAKEAGVTVTVENQSVYERCDSKIKDIRYILDCIPDLKYVLDAGNFFCVGEDVVEGYEFLSDRLVHVHFKDWAFDEKGSFIRRGLKPFEGVAIGTGVLPLKELIGKLKSDGYIGSTVLEINSKNLSLKMLDESADFLRSELNS